MSRTSQKEACLELLKEHPDRFMPVFWFLGEKRSDALGWVFLSHRAPARLTDLYQEGKADRQMVKGKTGARYYAYKFRPQVTS